MIPNLYHYGSKHPLSKDVTIKITFLAFSITRSFLLRMVLLETNCPFSSYWGFYFRRNYVVYVNSDERHKYRDDELLERDGKFKPVNFGINYRDDVCV